MRTEIIERGSGMSRKRYERKFSENDEDIHELMQESEADPTMEEQLKTIMEFCRQVLRASGFPDEVWVRLDGRKQRIYEYVIEQPDQDEDTKAGFAARILWHLFFALEPSTQKDKWYCTYHIDQAAALRAEFRLKFGKVGKFAELQLEKLEFGRAESAKSRAAKRDEITADFVAEATAIRQGNSQIKPHSVAKIIHDRRERENSKSSNDNQLPNQSVRRIRDKIKHLWE